MKQIFIDTNTYLSFFGVDSDSSSLFEFQKILTDKNSGIKLIITQQLLDEYERNVGSKIDMSRQKVAKELIDINVNTSDDIKREIEKDIEKIKEKAISIKQKKVEVLKKRFLETEKLIDEVFTLGTKVPLTDDIIKKAKERFNRGNPPRKVESQKDSYGDAINWEVMLSSVNDDLVIITNDPDYAELFDGQKIINRFLKTEWGKKNKEIILYTQLGVFINTLEKKPVISKEVIEKEIKSSDLISSIEMPLAYRILTTDARIFPVSGAVSNVLSGMPSFITNDIRTDEGVYLEMASKNIVSVAGPSLYDGASAVEVHKISDSILYGPKINIAAHPLGHLGTLDILKLNNGNNTTIKLKNGKNKDDTYLAL